jgi:hypothetical protein
MSWIRTGAGIVQRSALVVAGESHRDARSMRRPGGALHRRQQTLDREVELLKRMLGYA